MTVEQLLEQATERHRAGDLAQRRLYQQVLNQAQGHALALFRIGLLELQEGRLEVAVQLIEKAIAASPDEPQYPAGLSEAHFAVGLKQQERGDYCGAIVSYQTALRFNPESPDALNNLGNCYRLTHDLAHAEQAYRRALTIRPNYAAAMSNLGTVLQATSRVDQAVEQLRAAVALEPDAALHPVNLGAALCRQHKFSEAESVLRKAIQCDPNNADAIYNLGNALQGLGQSQHAVAQYRAAIALRPDYADAHNNLGNIYKERGEFKLAMASYDSAIRAQPHFVAALNNASCLLRTLGRLEEAEAVLRRGLALNPQHPALFNNLGNVLKDTGELDEAIECFGKSLALDPMNAATHSNLAYSLCFSSLQCQPILDECRRWNDLHAVPLRPAIRNYPNERSPHRRLRIGYVSPDFRDHCQSLFTIPLLSHHDHRAYEIFCYSSVERPDEYTRRIAGYADVWREARPLDDAALCEMIRTDRIDILVDLTMHMANGRPLLFARKAAPIQVAWLAYPGTTGISTMDYRFTDPWLDPPEFDAHYTERSIRLPDSFWCYDPLTDQPEVNPLPALQRGYVTLGCLNNPCKLTDYSLRLWGGVMRALPDARLILMMPPGSHREKLLQRLATHGIVTQRVSFVAYRPRSEYLLSYHDIDLGLDTYPYNGHTTSLDSFWMGAPVVTRVGQTCVGRGGLSQLFQLDLLELAGQTDEDFVNAAVKLANDLLGLAALRQSLRARLENSPLMDGRRFAKNIEAAYQQIWRDYCNP